MLSSIHAYLRDKHIKYREITKTSKLIFTIFFIPTAIGIMLGEYSLFGQETFFIIGLGSYTLMSGNIRRNDI